jgi:hypothetical protein
MPSNVAAIFEPFFVAVGDFNPGRQTSGAGILSFGALTLVDCNIVSNSSELGGGGGIVNFGGTLHLIGCLVAGNSSQGASVGSLAGPTSIDHSIVANNSGELCGGILAGSVSITNSTIMGNQAFAFRGGGTAHSGTVTIRDSVVARNSSIEQEPGSSSRAAVLKSTTALSRATRLSSIPEAVIAVTSGAVSLNNTPSRITGGMPLVRVAPAEESRMLAGR